MANEKILIVEDEGIVTLHIRNTIERLGYTVAGTAASGDDAIMQAMEKRPDLVLMDIVLKGVVDGIDAADKIRALFSIPVIYLTAHTDENTLRRAKITEPFGYIVKPFRERDLLIAIAFALYKSKMEAERKWLLQQLDDAREEVMTVRGLLPLCCSCGKRRQDDGYWDKVGEYMKAGAGPDSGHGMCPECASIEHSGGADTGD